MAPAGPDFLVYARTFDELLADDPGEDADRRDRLDAARDLSRQLNRGKLPPEQLIAEYLDRIARIEARSTPQSAPALEQLSAGSGIGEEELGDPDPGGSSPPQTKTAPEVELKSTEQALDDAREALAKNDYRGALDLLTPYQDREDWALLEEVWLEAVDGWVFQERERAGEMFRASRAWPQAERDKATLEVQAILEGLLEQYPETTYKAALIRNLQMVERELPP